MPVDDPEEPDDEFVTTDEWDEFREGEPIRVAELARLDLENMPEDVCISIFDDYFPETTIRRSRDHLICEIQEHLYTKYWEHKFSAYAFSDAMERAVRRLVHEGHPFAEPSREDDDVHIFARWHLHLPPKTQPELVATSVKSAFDLWQRANSIRRTPLGLGARDRQWRKLTYKIGEVERAVDGAAAWAEKFVAEFADYQIANLPWLTK